MQERAIGNEYRTSVVCVDAYDSQVMSGRIYNTFCEGICFHSTIDFLGQMEGLLNSMRCPQPFMTKRTLTEPAERPIPQPIDLRSQEGACATFAVRVMFRQNASWQGSILWRDRMLESRFRSVLELVGLMDDALTTTLV